MRVIAGLAKGRRLGSLRGRALRPTGERVREAVFVLGHPDPDELLGLVRGAPTTSAEEEKGAEKGERDGEVTGSKLGIHGRVLSAAREDSSVRPG
jgi:hypothetical protein